MTQNTRDFALVEITIEIILNTILIEIPMLHIECLILTTNITFTYETRNKQV